MKNIDITKILRRIYLENYITDIELEELKKYINKILRKYVYKMSMDIDEMVDYILFKMIESFKKNKNINVNNILNYVYSLIRDKVSNEIRMLSYRKVRKYYYNLNFSFETKIDFNFDYLESFRFEKFDENMKGVMLYLMWKKKKYLFQI